MIKKSLILIILMLCFILMLSCGETAQSGSDSENDGKVLFEGEDGNEVSVQVNIDSDVASYIIVRDDNADDDVIDLAKRLREDIKNKAGADVSLSTIPSAKKQIVLSLEDNMGGLDYGVTAQGSRIYIKGGSLESLTKAADLFVRNFVSGKEKAILLPADGGYTYENTYIFDKLTVEGVDFSEFLIFSDPSNATVRNTNISKTRELGEKLNTLLMTDILGKELEFAKALSSNAHHIIIKCSSNEVNPYSIEIRDGNIYISGSFLSVEAALDAFIYDIIGYKGEGDEVGRTLDITSAHSMEGSLGFTVPYEKSELIELFREANERDDMILTGTHTYGNTNGDGIRNTANSSIRVTGEATAILEIDVGHYGPYNPAHPGEDILTEYDISMFVSEGMEHVSNGGIMAIVAHLGNPLQNQGEGNSWYRGYIGNDAKVEEMLTEGTELNAAFRATLDSTLRVIKAYSDNGIPIMFRPFHELNADWFWWCANQGSGSLSPKAMTDMWKYVYNIVTVEMGCENVLWVYSTSTNGNGKKDVLYAYPGDEYVDIVGLDWYTNGAREYNSGEGYSNLMTLGKPVALTEMGPADGGSLARKDVDGRTYFTYDGNDMLGDIKQMIAEGLSISYFATWVGRTVYNLENGKVIMEDPIMISREDLALRWAEN